MDMYVWMTGALLVSTCAVCGTILFTKEREIKAKYGFDAKKTDACKRSQREADSWQELYWTEHAKVLDLEGQMRVKDIILSRTILKKGAAK